jgi:hypothetical protein
MKIWISWDRENNEYDVHVKKPAFKKGTYTWNGKMWRSDNSGRMCTREIRRLFPNAPRNQRDLLEVHLKEGQLWTWE